MGAIKKTSPKATDNNRYAGSFVKRNRRRIIVGREDKSALNNMASDISTGERNTTMNQEKYDDEFLRSVQEGLEKMLEELLKEEK